MKLTIDTTVEQDLGLQFVVDRFNAERAASDVLAQRNGDGRVQHCTASLSDVIDTSGEKLLEASAAGLFRIYGEYVDACNYERLTIERMPDGTVNVRSEAAGTGVQRAVRMVNEGAGEKTVIGKPVGSDWRIHIR